jgi:hypothetical protein
MRSSIPSSSPVLHNSLLGLYDDFMHGNSAELQQSSQHRKPSCDGRADDRSENKSGELVNDSQKVPSVSIGIYVTSCTYCILGSSMKHATDEA